MKMPSPVYLLIVFERLFDDHTERLLHDALYLQHPVLHVAGWIQSLTEIHTLTLSGVHFGDFQVLLELEL